MKKIGFCKQCLRNVPHILYFSWPVLRLLNRYPKFTDSLPLASWHCCGCEKNSFRLRRPDPEVNTDVTSTDMSDVEPWPDRDDPTQRFGMIFRRKKKTKVLDPSSAAENELDQAESEFEHVGNVTRTDESLLVRHTRAARYSEKFRDGVVDRVLSGQSSISQIRNELTLSERDLLDWIKDRVTRQDTQIYELTKIAETVQQLSGDIDSFSFATSALRLDETEADSTDSFSRFDDSQGITIDGNVKRK